MTHATLNESCAGRTRSRIGTRVEIVSPGANSHHLIVRYPDQRRTWGCPRDWLDMDETRPVRRGVRVRKGMLG